MTRAEVEPITIDTSDRTGISNIRWIVRNINQSITLIQDSGDEQVAEILKEIGKAVINSPRVEKQAGQAVIESLRTLAWEASLPSAERRLGIVKASLAYIPMLLSMDLDTLNYFEVHLGDLRKFFNISS